MTVGEAIRFVSVQLAERDIPNATVEAELMLSHLLLVPRTILFMKSGVPLDPPHESALMEFIERRSRHEPLQHILGSVSFCGIELTVNEDALIPRPETELLAEMAWTHLDSVPSAAPRVLDFGTGTGCLAIAIAMKQPRASVHALDRSPKALALADRNAQELNLSDRIHFHEGDGFDALPEDMKFDLIVSNPPYIASEEIRELQPEVRDYDPRLALDGGTDGLDFYRRLAERTGKHLSPDGVLMCEFGDGQEKQLELIFSSENWMNVEFEADMNRKPRFMSARTIS